MVIIRVLFVSVMIMFGLLSPIFSADLQQYLNDLNNEDRYYRQQAVKALSQMGPEIIPQLIEKLGLPHGAFCGHAAQVLVNFGKVSVPALMGALKDPDKQVVANAAWALREIGEDAKEAGPGLLDLLDDENDLVRSYAVEALGSIGYVPDDAIDKMIKLLEDPDENVRNFAIRSLGKCKEKAKPAVPAIIKLLDDPDSSTRMYAMTALGEIGDERGVPGLAGMIRKGETWDGMTYYALAKIGGEETIDVFVEILGSPPALLDGQGYVIFPPGFQENAFAADQLTKIGKPAVPALIKALSNANPVTRFYSAEILGDIGAGASEVIPALNKAANDAQPDVQKKVKEALDKLSQQQPQETSQPKLSQEEIVISLAEEHAISKGYDLTQYDKPKAEFDEEDRVWGVSFGWKKEGDMVILGSFLIVNVSANLDGVWIVEGL